MLLVVLYGSRACGNAQERSDFDIHVTWNLASDPNRWGAYCNDLREQSPVLNSIDIARLDLISSALRREVENTGKVIYDKSATHI